MMINGLNYGQLGSPYLPSGTALNSMAFPQIQQEEITTIFVVGFPEDMYEREFQNMFIFCPGFEAATLKIPTSTDVNDDSSSASGKKQIIGFAKFRTRQDAMDARNILSGRKVDAERGCVLKAEMAKKNLHTKRGLSNENPAQSVYASQLARRQPPPGFTSVQSKDPLYSADPFSAYLGSPPQIPRDLLTTPEYGTEGAEHGGNYLEDQNAQLLLEEQQLQKQQNQQQQQQLLQQLQQQQLQLQQLQQQQQQQQQQSQSVQQHQQNPQVTSVQTRQQTSPSSYSDSNNVENQKNVRENLYSDILDLRSMSTLTGNLSAPTRPTFLEQRIDSPLLSSSMDTFDGSMLQRSQTTTDRGFNSALYQSDSLLPQRMGDLRINTSFGLNGITSPLSGLSSMVSPATPLSSYQPYRTGADQNPPCNTLYVGNLPPNTSEQELLQLFSRSVGFKRLLFRNRPNGPMCFVEFDDINCATLALRELSGSLLSNSTKGGIRLSYSKNPLGVRQQPASNTTQSQQQQLLSPQLYLESRLIHGH